MRKPEAQREPLERQLAGMAFRQVIYEFGPDATVFYEGAHGPKQSHIAELLPEGFRLK